MTFEVQSLRSDWPNVMDEQARGRKHFLMRVEPTLFDALQRWAAQEMRSVNAQIEWILRDAVLRRQRAGALLEPEADHPARDE